jgi:hypothetical protein
MHSLGAAASSDAQSPVVVSAILVDTGMLSFTKTVGVTPIGLKFLEP